MRSTSTVPPSNSVIWTPRVQPSESERWEIPRAAGSPDAKTRGRGRSARNPDPRPRQRGFQNPRHNAQMVSRASAAITCDGQQARWRCRSAGQKAFDQIEIAVKVDVDLRVDSARNRQDRDQHPEQQQQDQGLRENPEWPGRHDATVRPTIPPAGREAGCRSSRRSIQHHRDQRRQRRQFERSRQSRQHQFEHHSGAR